jgi:hypothetical protein
MSDKSQAPYSLTRALLQTAEHGVLTSVVERETHFELLRALESSRAMRGTIMPGGKFHSLYAPLSVIHRDLSVTGGPSSGGVLVGLKTFGRTDLASWSAVIDSGALLVTGLRENATFWQVSTLPVPSWNSEVGAIIETDPIFTGFNCTPKRLSAMTIIQSTLVSSIAGFRPVATRQFRQTIRGSGRSGRVVRRTRDIAQCGLALFAALVALGH